MPVRILALPPHPRSLSKVALLLLAPLGYGSGQPHPSCSFFLRHYHQEVCYFSMSPSHLRLLSSFGYTDRYMISRASSFSILLPKKESVWVEKKISRMLCRSHATFVDTVYSLPLENRSPICVRRADAYS